MVEAHEMEHVLANQGLGNPSAINDKYDELVSPEKNPEDSRSAVVKRLVDHAPYLVKNWGLSPGDAKTGYFSQAQHAYQGEDAPNLLYEQMATLSALEQIKNKQLTEDPYVRKNILTTPAQRETYNALTGLRQSRLDPRDLPTYTRQPEKQAAADAPQKNAPDSTYEKLKKMLGYASGGSVQNAGNNKLI